jgi:antibiotic biosynthesis monooxygenase (ABM) superfamily enzyme
MKNEMEKNGILMIQTDVLPDKEAEWNNWYDTKHIPARLEVPGIRAVRRFIAIEGNPKYLTIYELASVDVLTSEAYLAMRDREASLPPDSFEFTTAKFPNFSRGLFELINPEQEEYRMPDSEIIFAVGHDVPPDKEEEFNAWYNTEHIPAMKRVPGILTARRFRAKQIQLPSRAGAGLSGPKYSTLYDFEDDKILESESFLREKDSPWSFWVRSWYDRRFRILGRRIYPKR